MAARAGVLLIVLALFAAACGSDDGGGDTAADTTTTTTTAEETTTTTTEASTSTTVESTTTTTEPAPLTASFRGVTEDTIRLGFLWVDFGELEALGLYEGNQGDARVVIEALVDDLNARGGILGRQIEPYVEIYLPISVTDAEETCLRLTEDNEVFAVLGRLSGPTEVADGCFTEIGETIKIGGLPSPEDLEKANAPWYTVSFTDRRSISSSVNLLHQEGVITEPLAVIWAPEDDDAAQSVAIPELENLGYEVALTVTYEADAGDRPALDAEWTTIVERLRVDGISTVLLVGDSAGINGPNQLVLQGWEGQTLVSSYNLLNSVGQTAQVSAEELASLLGTLGATDLEAFELEASQECVRVFEAANPGETVRPASEVPQDETDWWTPLIAHCQTLKLFELIATAAGPELTQDSFVAGAESLGEIDLPAIPLASLGPGKIDATDGMRLGKFDPTIGEFGRGAPAGDLVRVP